MPNNAAWDTATTDPANRATQAVSLNVAARAAASPAPSGLLVQYDFAAGDTLTTPSINTIGFNFERSRPMATAPNGQVGVEFSYQGGSPANGSDSVHFKQLSYSLGAGIDENYERILLWIPSNYEHRKMTRLRLVTPNSADGWVKGDLVRGANGSSEGLFDFTDGTYVWLKYAELFFADSVWVGTITNLTQSLSVDTDDRNFAKPGNNNKFNAQWEGSYSSNGMIPEYNSGADNLVTEPSLFTCKATSAISPSSGGGDANNSGTTGNRPSDTVVPAGIDPATDLGKLHEFVTRRKRATAMGANDGLCQIWKNGVLVYEVLDFPLFSATNNFFTQGYLLGYANSGFEETTTFYITKYELYGDTPPEGITP